MMYALLPYKSIIDFLLYFESHDIFSPDHTSETFTRNYVQFLHGYALALMA